MPLVIIFLVLLLVVYLHDYCYKRLWDKGLGFRVLFSHKEVFEGDELQIRMELTNKKFLPLPWVFVKAEMSKEFQHSKSGTIENDSFLKSTGMLTSIMMFSMLRKRTYFTCKKRGVFRLYRANLSVGNLLHTEEFEKDVKLDGEVLVFPKTLDEYDSVDLVYKVVDSVVQSKALINPDPFEFRGIREYQPTDALKSINFKATAISQKLMVNIHAPTTAYKLTIVLNVDGSQNYSNWELYEQSIRLAATLAKHYIEAGANISFLTNGRDTASGEALSVRGGNSGAHMYVIYEALARIALRIKPRAMCEFADAIMDKEQVYLFISPYSGEDFLDSFNRLRERQVSAHLVVPYYRRPSISLSENITIWDAKPL